MAKVVVLLIPLIIGAVVLILGCVLGFVVFPTLIDDEIKKNVILEQDTLQWYRFVEIPFPIKFSVNFFTIENPTETLNNEIPIVKERGPYVYSETRQKVIKSIEKDLVHYDELWKFEFNAEASGNNTEDDIITVINAPLMGILQNLEDLPFALPVDLDIILNDIFEDPRMFFPVKIRDYAFGGIKMCDPERTTTGYSMLVCLVIMLMNLKLIHYNEDRSMLFSLFGYKTKPDGTFTMHRGIDNIEKLGLITGYKGLEYTNYWKGEKSTCDKVEGHYTTFPPFMEENTSWQVYSTDICKGGKAHYTGGTTYKDVDGYRFATDEFSFASASEDCVCINATKGLDGKPDHCFSEGVLDLNTCLGAPVVLSFPHLMWAGEQYKTGIQGLNPEYNEKHNTIIDFEPHLGFPLRGAIRIQFNIVLRPIQYAGSVIESTSKLPPALFPIIWLEDSFELTDALIEELNTELLNKLVLVEGVKWGLIAVGLVMLIITIGFCIFRKTRK